MSDEASRAPRSSTPKFLISGDDLDDDEAIEQFLALVKASARDRQPVTCPTCGSTEVTATNGTPPRYRCENGHGWAGEVVVLDERQ